MKYRKKLRIDYPPTYYNGRSGGFRFIFQEEENGKLTGKYEIADLTEKQIYDLLESKGLIISLDPIK